MAKNIKAKAGWVGGKTEGGSGGKLGHSNMTHWDYTAIIKAAAKKARRHADKSTVADQLADM